MPGESGRRRWEASENLSRSRSGEPQNALPLRLLLLDFIKNDPDPAGNFTAPTAVQHCMVHQEQLACFSNLGSGKSQ